MAKKKKERSATPKLGATYQAAKLAVQIASPATDAIVTREPMTADTARAKLNTAYGQGMVIGIVDAAASKYIGHAGALSRKSITALAPEVYAVGSAAAYTASGEAGPNKIEEFNNQYVVRTTGYSPAFNDFGFRPENTIYFGLKYGGGIARKALNKTGFMDPVKKALSMMGMTL